MSSRDPREVPLDGDEPAGPGHGGARVLSLEERKQQRQREREAARAARIAALMAGGEEAARPGRLSKAERRARALEGRDDEAAGDEAPGPRPVPGLGGVRPLDGLAGGPGREAGAGAALGPAASPFPVARPAPERPSERPPADDRRSRSRKERKRDRREEPDEGAADEPHPEPASPARARSRHWLVVLSFLLLVVGPTVATAWYVWERATPRYASYAALSVRSEEGPSAVDLLGGAMQLAGNTTGTDSQVLYEFLQSQEVVRLIDERLDLRALWAKGDPDRDPVFAYHPPGTIEDLHDYWKRMVTVYTDGSTGLLDIEVQAFDAADAQTVMQAIVDEGTILVNRLSDQAQADSTRYAEQDLADSVEQLKAARAALTRFRNETQIVDPASAVASQMGLLSQLEGTLAQQLIDLDLLRQTVPDGDPRITQAESRVEVIEARMAAERAKLGLGSGPGAAAASTDPAPADPTPGGEEDGPASEGAAADGGAPGGEAFADLVGQYESLAVDQQFAEQAYTAARTAYESALAEGRRQSRYLAAHVQPTLAERAEYPGRVSTTLLALVFAFLAWSILTMAAYALRDRR